MKNQFFSYLFLLLNFISFNGLANDGQEISVQELHKQISKGSLKAKILDVRTPKEIKATGVIKGAIVKNAFDANIADYINKLDPKKEYIVYCYSGGRSNNVIKKMKRRGIKGINLTGGISAWKKEKFPLVKK